jgi:putative membrane protein
MKKSSFLRQFRWKIFLLRIMVHAIALGLTVLILPDIYFINFSISSLPLVTLVLGVLNAVLRPILELLTFRLLFVSFGLVIVLINTLVLYLLALIVPNRFAVDSLLWALVGGFLVGILGNFLENLFGVTLPILPDEAKELRRQIAEQDVSLLEAWIQERKAARKQAKAAEGAETLPEPAGQAAIVETPASEREVEAEAVEAPASEPAAGAESVEALESEPAAQAGSEPAQSKEVNHESQHPG